MRQPPSTARTEYEVATRPSESDGYVQRIPMWEAVRDLGRATRVTLLRELERRGYKRPMGAPLDESYCRIELTDMTKRGFLRRVNH